MKHRVGSVVVRPVDNERRLRDIVGHTREVNLQRRHALARHPHKGIGDAEVLIDETFESHLS